MRLDNTLPVIGEFITPVEGSSRPLDDRPLFGLWSVDDMDGEKITLVNRGWNRFELGLRLVVPISAYRWDLFREVNTE